tara:strand:+ start:703 stop:1167 length:465 start_codon:yes stop_codon:yes gene_type:complete
MRATIALTALLTAVGVFTLYYATPVIFPEIDAGAFFKRVWYYPVVWTTLGIFGVTLMKRNPRRNKSVENNGKQGYWDPLQVLEDPNRKDFMYTFRSKSGKVLLQQIVTFGSEENPFPEDWEENPMIQRDLFDYKQRIIDEYFTMEISEDLTFHL